jgi:hypothetical protein
MRKCLLRGTNWVFKENKLSFVLKLLIFPKTSSIRMPLKITFHVKEFDKKKLSLLYFSVIKLHIK